MKFFFGVFIWFIALAPCKVSAQFALNVTDATGNNYPTPLTYFLTPEPQQQTIWQNWDKYRIWLRLDSICTPPVQPHPQGPIWKDWDLYRIWLKLDSCFSNAITVDSVIAIAQNKVDSTDRRLDSVFYYINGSEHFSHLDSVGFVQQRSDLCNITAGAGAGAVDRGVSNSWYGVNAGSNILPTGNSNVAVGCNSGQNITGGDGNIFIGAEAKAQSNVSNSIAIGFGAYVTASQQCVIGGGATLYYLGGGPSGNSGNSVSLQVTEITGTNVGGNNLTLKGGRGTGTGTPGDLIIATYDTTASGTTPQTSTTKMIVKGSGNVGVGTASPSATLHINGSARFDNGNAGINEFVISTDADGNLDYLELAIEGDKYIPEYTEIANLDTLIVSECQYIRASKTVTVSGALGCDVTLAATQTEFLLTIPITSAFDTDSDCGGAGFCPTVFGWGTAIEAEATGTGTARFRFISSAVTTEQKITFTFTYTIK